MAKGKLYGAAGNFRTQKVLIAAKLGKTDIELAGENAPANKFPFGQTPAYDEGDKQIFGAEAIAAYVGKLNICPGIEQWLQWAEGSLLPNVLGFVLPSLSAAALDTAIVAVYKAELTAQLDILDKYLVSRTFLVGERLTLADISVALDLLPAFQNVLCPGFRKSHVALTRWFLTIVNQPAAKEVLGDVKLAEKTAQFDQAEYNKIASKFAATAGPKDEKKLNGVESTGGIKKNKKQAKKEQPKKEQPKKEAKKKDDEELDAADAAVAAEPKQSDPFAGLPASTFNLDAFKRSYSNEDTEKVAIPHFWENFDKANWSIWKCEYKFPAELTLTFMSCNLISGMYQRLEKLKKNGFASMCLFGSDNNSTISGIWVWRGDKLAFPLCDDWQIDYESYDWEKLDADADSTKKLVKEYFMWEGDFDGKKFNQGKIFK